MRKQKYDLIFSVGEACSCTSALRGADLQLKSYPLDWLFGSDFIGRCKIVASRFNRFIEKNDLEYTYSERSISCDAYHNKYNDLTFNHDFATGRPLDETYPAVSEKYARRISRLLESIDKSQRVLVVYIETPVKDHDIVDNKDLIRGHQIIADAFPDTVVDLLYFSNSNSKKQTEQVSDHIIRIYDDYKDKTSELDYVVIGDILIKHLQNFKLNIAFGKKIKREFTRILINMIPIGKIKHNLRRKYHVK